MPHTLHPVPILHGPIGHAIPYTAVLDELGEPLMAALDPRGVRRGGDFLTIVTGWRVRQTADAPLVRITVKLTRDGTYALERGHVDPSSSMARYRVDQQLLGADWCQLRDAVAAIVVGAVAADLGTLTASA